MGRSSWAPRRVKLGELAGNATVRVRLHGSWNNVFSRLNRVENGFTNQPVLHSTVEIDRTLKGAV
jgi:hypothetical protein